MPSSDRGHDTRPKSDGDSGPGRVRRSLKSLLAMATRSTGAFSQVLFAVAITRSLDRSGAGAALLYLTAFAVGSATMTGGSGYFAMRRLSGLDRDDPTIAFETRRLFRLQLGLAAAASLMAAIVLATLGTGIVDLPRGGVMIYAAAWWVSSSLTTISLAVAYQCHGRRHLIASVWFSHIMLPLTSASIVAGWAAWSEAASIRALDVVAVHVGVAAVTAATAAGYWLTHVRGAMREASGETVSEPDPMNIPDALRSCGSFWLMNVSQLLMNWSPFLIAGLLLPLPDQAHLGAAQRVAGGINLILVVATFVVTPRLRYHYARGDSAALRRTVAETARVLVPAGLAATVIAAVAAGPLMSLFGEGYRAAGGLLIVFALGQCFNVVTGTVNQILTMCDRESVLKNVCLASAVGSVALGAVLTYAYGPVGTAAAAASALVLQNVIAVTVVRRVFGFWVFDVRGGPAASVEKRPASAIGESG